MFVPHLFLFSILINALTCMETRNLTRHDRHARALLYPSLTDLQLTLCTVSPVFNRKFGRLATNLGFQLNFRLPWQLVDFYRPTYWARATSDIITGRILPASESEEHGRYYYESNGLTAGKLYKATESFLETMGYHPDCLVKSVCELAHTPFDAGEEHLVQEIIHFLLT
nr:uncharacterized protein LOC115261126 [Aedes albopictus]